MFIRIDYSCTVTWPLFVSPVHSRSPPLLLSRARCGWQSMKMDCVCWTIQWWVSNKYLHQHCLCPVLSHKTGEKELKKWDSSLLQRSAGWIIAAELCQPTGLEWVLFCGVSNTRNPQENKMASLRFKIFDPNRQPFQHVNDVSLSSVIFSSPCRSISFLVWRAALLMHFHDSQGEKNKVKITRSGWKLCHTSSHPICPSGKAETKRIPRSILRSAIKSEHAPCLYHCTFHTGNAFILQHTLVTYSYQSVITFGGCRDDFMVVTSQQREPGVGKKSVEKLVFVMAKPKVGIMSISAHMFNLFDWQVSTLPPHVRWSLFISLDNLKQDSQTGISVHQGVCGNIVK